MTAPSTCTCCPSFTRSQALLRAGGTAAGVVRAGHGLPAIEPGMPVPAGTGMRRRSFLIAAGGVALSVYGPSRLGAQAFREGIAAAAGMPPGRVLVSVFMPGGVDSMSLLAPVGDPRYARLRPNLKLAPGTGPAFAEDSRLMWHPAARSLATLYGEGKVSVLPAVGYDHPDQSHFTSRHYWEVGQLDTGVQTGWLGRMLDAGGATDNPLQGLSLNGALNPSLATASAPVAALDSPAAYSFTTAGVDEPVAGRMLQAIADLGAIAVPASEPAFAGARRTTAAAGQLRSQMTPFVTPDGNPRYGSPVAYPPNSSFASHLAGLAAMLAGGLPLRLVTIDADDTDFDTHSEQGPNFGPRIAAVMDALLAFQRDLEARGLADRVLVNLWSEFGRRPEENGSGTDHGAAGAAFVIGSHASGRMAGEFPGLAKLDDNDNLVATSDFRSLYCTLIEGWLGQDPGPVIPGAGSLPRLGVLR